MDAPALPAHMRGLLALNPSCPAPRHSAGNGVDSCYTIYTQVLEQHGIFKQEPRVRCQKDSKSRALCDSKKSSGKKYTAYTAHISSPREKKHWDASCLAFWPGRLSTCVSACTMPTVCEYPKKTTAWAMANVNQRLIKHQFIYWQYQIWRGVERTTGFIFPHNFSCFWMSWQFIIACTHYVSDILL